MRGVVSKITCLFHEKNLHSEHFDWQRMCSNKKTTSYHDQPETSIPTLRLKITLTFKYSLNEDWSVWATSDKPHFHKIKIRTQECTQYNLVVLHEVKPICEAGSSDLKHLLSEITKIMSEARRCVGKLIAQNKRNINM